jgi:V8-like Glu-specific endopeptidase
MIINGKPDDVLGEIVERNIVPIFVVEKTHPGKLISFQGTGFILAPNLLITCWHCVSSLLPDNQQYAAIIPTEPEGYRALYLNELEQDLNASDVAIANVATEPTLGLTLAKGDVSWGTHVWTYGYPLTIAEEVAGAGKRFTLSGRYLQGYVTQAFYYKHHKYGQVRSYELSMPIPEGLSGAPLIKVGSKEVIGLIYGNNDVATIEQFARVNSQTEKREPEVQRIISFGLAHHLETLRNLRSATNLKVHLANYLVLMSQKES